MLVARKHVDDAIQGFGAIIGMQRSDAQVTGAGQGCRGLHGFLIANFAHQNDIGGRPNRAAQCPGK